MFSHSFVRIMEPYGLTKIVVSKIVTVFSALPFLLATLSLSVATCPTGYDHTFQSSCYKVELSNGKSRSQARADCESDSGHLIFIETQDENQALAAMYGSTQSAIWIGLNGVLPAALTWDDGTTAEYTSFDAQILPTYYASGCYRLVPWNYPYSVDADTWHDDVCSISLPYICEYEDTATTTTTTEPTTTKAETTRATTTEATTTQAETTRVTTTEATTTQADTTRATTTVPTSTKADTTYTATTEKRTTIADTTLVPTTVVPTTEAETTTRKTTTEQKTTTAETTTHITTTERTSTENIGIDFGEALGLATTGFNIPSDSTVTSYVATPVTRCNIRCSRFDCFAVLFQRENDTCYLAVRGGITDIIPKRVISRVMHCKEMGGLLICS